MGTAREAPESEHLEQGSKEAVVSPVCKEGSLETKFTEATSEKVGDQRSKESHIDASPAKEDTGSKSNVRENLEEKIKTDISGSPAPQHPVAAGEDREEKVCLDADEDDVASDGQMSSNGASVEASTEGEILCDVSRSLSRSEPSPPTADVTPTPASDLLPQPTQPSDRAASSEKQVKTISNQKYNSQIPQEEKQNSDNLNDSRDMINHQKGSPACSERQSIQPDKLVNGHKYTPADKVQTEKKEKGSFESTKLAPTSQSGSMTNPSKPSSTSSSTPVDIKSTLVDSKSTLVSLEERLATCGLPEAVEDAEFDNKLKVFTNYRNFGAMYQSKNNFKKAEWAFKNGIKQAVGCEALRSKEQLRAVIAAELEFRLERAKALMRLGQQSEAKVECSTVLIIDSSNTEAPSLLS